MRNTLPLAALAVSLLAVTAGDARAQATDLVCNECVQATDVAPNAVNNSKIANAAVTAAKLASNAVTVAKIANNSITAAKITTAAVTFAKIGPNAVRTSKIANAAVTAAKIAPGAVKSSKIAEGAVTAAKLAPGAVFLRSIIVEATGPTDSDNCTALLDALAETGSATADAPYLIKLGPGRFDCGEAEVTLPAFVHLEGAGQAATEITSDADYSSTNGDPVVASLRLQNDSSLRRVSVTNFGGNEDVIALRTGSANVIISEAFISAAATSGSIARALEITGGSMILTDVTAASSSSFFSTAISVSPTAVVKMNRVRAGTADILPDVGLGSSGTVTARNSVLMGGSSAISILSSGTYRIANSEIDGGVNSILGGSPVCVGVYNQNLSALGADCEAP